MKFQELWLRLSRHDRDVLQPYLESGDEYTFVRHYQVMLPETSLETAVGLFRYLSRKTLEHKITLCGFTQFARRFLGRLSLNRKRTKAKIVGEQVVLATPVTWHQFRSS